MYRTVKFKLPNFNDVPMMEEGVRCFNWYVNLIRTLKARSRNDLTGEQYFKARAAFPDLKSSHIYAIRDNALAVCKRWKLNRPGCRKIVVKRRLSMQYNNGGISFLQGNTISYSTPSGRKLEVVEIPSHAKGYVKGDLKCGTIKKENGQWMACLTFKLPTPERLPYTNSVGVDLGINVAAATSDRLLIFSKQLDGVRGKYDYLKRQYQKRGTRSAKRRLKTLSGKVANFTKNVMHELSKKLVNLPATHLVLEDLTNIPRRGMGRKHNRRMSTWARGQLTFNLLYKAEAAGKEVEFVNPANTSKICHACGKFNKRNKGLYKCSCGYRNHADINGALNILARSARGCEQVGGDLPNGDGDIPNAAVSTVKGLDSLRVGASPLTEASSGKSLIARETNG